MLRDAFSLLSPENVLAVEQWASDWLGQAWLTAEFGERDPEHRLCLEVIGRASTRPSAHGLAAVAALRRVAPPGDIAVLDSTLAILSESQPLPSWFDADPFEPVRAWRAVDVWDSERMLFVEYAGPFPHTLMAQVVTVGGVVVEKLGLLQREAAETWESYTDPDEVPMPITEHPVPEVLAELAEALWITDLIFPRHDDEDFVDLRALARARCSPYLPDAPGQAPTKGAMSEGTLDDDELDDELDDDEALAAKDAERERLLDDFVSTATHAEDLPDDEEVLRSLADIFLDYGETSMTTGPLCWSPGWVAVFLTDWLPRKGILDAEQRAALPAALRHWVRFALERRDVEDRWITPVVEAVDSCAPEFADAFDDDAAWGPAKQVAMELLARGVDMSDPDAVDAALRALNAENLARRLIDE